MKRALLGLLLSVLVASPVFAQSISYEFSGVLTYLWESDKSAGTSEIVEQTDFFGDSYQKGQEFKGSFTYDILATKTNDDPSWGFYYKAIISYEVTINDFTYLAHRGLVWQTPNPASTRSLKFSKFRYPKAMRVITLSALLVPSTNPLVTRSIK